MKCWTTSYAEILELLDDIKPVKYSTTRNFIDGDVSLLSPYISRGVISTKQVYSYLLKRGFELTEMEKFIQELAWRDYWQQVWRVKGDDIFSDIKHQQPNGIHLGLPKSIADGKTGIQAIDQSIEELYESGYMHNHVRMYVAALATNMGKCKWQSPAQWMYYHLLDGDLASNHLSWQWVAGSNSNKCYVANQENINKYCHTNQKNTFLDVPYEAFGNWDIPEVLQEIIQPIFDTKLPDSSSLDINPALPTLIYNEYNLDPRWHANETANRIMLFEPDIYQRFPVSPKRIEFTLSLSHNIDGIQVYTGSFKSLKLLLGESEIIFKEHPLNQYEGTEEPRDWLSSVEGFFPSFFPFWKRCKKELKSEIFH